MEALFVYMAVINLMTFIMMGIDKTRAKSNKSRVAEKKLFILAALGGAMGGWIGMRIWRHKTQHPSFVIGFLLLFLLNVACIYILAQVF